MNHCNLQPNMSGDEVCFFEAFIDKKRNYFLILVLAISIAGIFDLMVEVPALLFMFGFPLFVMCIVCYQRIVEVLCNKPQIVVTNNYIFCNKLPVKYVYNEDIESVFLSLGNEEILRKYDSTLKKSKYAYRFEIQLKNIDEYISRCPWYWKLTLKMKKLFNDQCVSFKLEFYDLIPNELLKYSKFAIGHGMETDVSDIKFRAINQ